VMKMNRQARLFRGFLSLAVDRAGRMIGRRRINIVSPRSGGLQRQRPRMKTERSRRPDSEPLIAETPLAIGTCGEYTPGDGRACDPGVARARTVRGDG
jgi:hypothetical protein